MPCELFIVVLNNYWSLVCNQSLDIQITKRGNHLGRTHNYIFF